MTAVKTPPRDLIAPILMWMGYRTKEVAATTAFVATFSSLSG